LRDPTRSYLQLSISTRQLNYTPSSSVPSVSRSGKLRSPGESGHCGHGAHRRCACWALDLRLFDVGLETEKARERGGAQGLGELRDQGHVEEKPAMDRKSRIRVSQNSQISQGGGVLRIKATSRRKSASPGGFQTLRRHQRRFGCEFKAPANQRVYLTGLRALTMM